MKPETPLPWDEVPNEGNAGSFSVPYGDHAYLVHAANAYPKLVSVLRHCALGYQDEEAEVLLSELGEWQ